MAPLVGQGTGQRSHLPIGQCNGPATPPVVTQMVAMSCHRVRGWVGACEVHNLCGAHTDYLSIWLCVSPCGTEPLLGLCNERLPIRISS
ncbi:hypothetical protein XENTR_v10007443 [Xenopus tropicalis]|nr:hypothetical protein XENTR_v10007443 [Xenopus tropicalis]